MHSAESQSNSCLVSWWCSAMWFLASSSLVARLISVSPASLPNILTVGTFDSVRCSTLVSTCLKVVIGLWVTHILRLYNPCFSLWSTFDVRYSRNRNWVGWLVWFGVSCVLSLIKSELSSLLFYSGMLGQISHKLVVLVSCTAWWLWLCAR